MTTKKQGNPASSPRKRTTRYSDPRVLTRAVEEWARDHVRRRLGAELDKGNLAHLRALARPGRRDDAQERRAERDQAALLKALRRASAWQDRVAPGPKAQQIRMLGRRAAEMLRFWPEQPKRVSAVRRRQKGARWMLLASIAGPMPGRDGQPWRASKTGLWWWLDGSPTEDDLTAACILAGLFEADAVESLIMQSERGQRAHPTLADAIETERKRVRVTIAEMVGSGERKR